MARLKVGKSETTFSAKINNQYNIGKSCQIQLSGVYFAPMNIPQERRAARVKWISGSGKTFTETGSNDWFP